MSIEKQSADIMNLLLAIQKAVESPDWHINSWALKKAVINRMASEQGYESALREFVSWFESDPTDEDEAEESD